MQQICFLFSFIIPILNEIFNAISQMLIHYPNKTLDKFSGKIIDEIVANLTKVDV